MSNEPKTRRVARKITISDVCGKVAKGSITEPKNLMNVLARVTSMKPQETQYGPYIDFRGQFEATNLETGEIHQGSRMIVPSIVEQELEAAFEGSESDGVILAAFTVGVQPSERGSMGYEYTLEVAGTTDAGEIEDPFVAIRENVAKALPAPAKSKVKK
jgi:hypothetical protein